ncbi:amidase family protein [Sandarakinorhabdus sp.]|uniref:amidase family protein n=1 Tax=Sandarakinorhabdus sp. TaxID=1916663 RepID=UPI003F6E82EE
MNSADMIELSASAAVAAMRAGEMSALDYAEALLARCAAGAGLNAFITLDPDAVRAAARAANAHRAAGGVLGPLHGLPIPVKDSVNTAGIATTVGTRALRGWIPARDGTTIARLKAAGAIVLGKTNIHELSFGWTSSNLEFGPVRNPHDPSRIPGGSSGGTAAAVAARMAPLGVAEDTQGSIRVPAALCGIAGFRPTTGRYPTDGTAPITPLFDQIGPHARCVADLALFDAVVSGEDAPIVPATVAGLRIGIDRAFFFAGLDAEVAALTERALELLAAAGAVIVEAPVPGLDQIVPVAMAIQVHDVVPALEDYLRESGAPVDFETMFAGVSADVAAVFTQMALRGAPSAITAELYAAARDVARPALQQAMAAWFADHRIDAMLLPATMVPATPVGDQGDIDIGGVAVSFVTAIARNISPASTLGLPALVLPCGRTRAGLPVGIELDGPAGSDRRLLAIGMAVEALLGPLPAPVLRG